MRMQASGSLGSHKLHDRSHAAHAPRRIPADGVSAPSSAEEPSGRRGLARQAGLRVVGAAAIVCASAAAMVTAAALTAALAVASGAYLAGSHLRRCLLPRKGRRP